MFLFLQQVFENFQIHIPQSLLLFSAYHLQSQIVYWISNIGLSASQYAVLGEEGGATFRKWSKIGVEMKIGGELIVGWEGGCWQDNLTVHRVDESGKKHLQFQVGQNNVMLSDGGKKYGWDGWIGPELAGKTASNQLRYWQQGHAMSNHIFVQNSKYICSKLNCICSKVPNVFVQKDG